MACYCSIVGRGFSSRLLVPRWWSSFWGVICPLFPVCFYFLLLLLYFTSLISISPLHAFCPLIYTPYCIPFELSFHICLYFITLFSLLFSLNYDYLFALNLYLFSLFFVVLPPHLTIMLPFHLIFLFFYFKSCFSLFSTIHTFQLSIWFHSLNCLNHWFSSYFLPSFF